MPRKQLTSRIRRPQTAWERLEARYEFMLYHIRDFAKYDGNYLFGTVPRRARNGENGKLTTIKELLYMAAKRDRDPIAKLYFDVARYISLRTRTVQPGKGPYAYDGMEDLIELWWVIDEATEIRIKAGILPKPGFKELLDFYKANSGEFSDYDLAIHDYFMQHLFSPEIREQGILERHFFRSAMERFDQVPHSMAVIDRVFEAMLAQDPPWVEVRERTNEIGQQVKFVIGTKEGLHQYHQQQLRGGLPS